MRTSCREKPSEGACRSNMSFILNIIISLTQVTSRGGGGILSCFFKAKGVDTKFETSCTKDDITRQVEKLVFGKDVRRMRPKVLFVGTSLVISRAFALCSLGWVSE